MKSQEENASWRQVSWRLFVTYQKLNVLIHKGGSDFTGRSRDRYPSHITSGFPSLSALCLLEEQMTTTITDLQGVFKFMCCCIWMVAWRVQG